MIKIKHLLLYAFVFAVPAFSFAADSDLFESIDKDKDETITREEFISCPLVRGKTTTGKDRIKPKDLCANPLTDLSVEEKERLFEKLDTDKSGTLHNNELNKYATPDGFAPIRF